MRRRATIEIEYESDSSIDKTIVDNVRSTINKGATAGTHFFVSSRETFENYHLSVTFESQVKELLRGTREGIEHERSEMCLAVAQLLADRFGTRVFVEFERGLHHEPHRVEDTWVAPEKSK